MLLAAAVAVAAAAAVAIAVVVEAFHENSCVGDRNHRAH